MDLLLRSNSKFLHTLITFQAVIMKREFKHAATDLLTNNADVTTRATLQIISKLSPPSSVSVKEKTCSNPARSSRLLWVIPGPLRLMTSPQGIWKFLRIRQLDIQQCFDIEPGHLDLFLDVSLSNDRSRSGMITRLIFLRSSTSVS